MYKNKGGRPLKFKSNKALQERIDEYFNSCFEPAFGKNGEPLIDYRTGKQLMKREKAWTKGGLAYYLGIDRKTLYNYLNNENGRFFPIIKKAVAKIEAYAEEQLFVAKNVAGVIFYMKNSFGWRDSPTKESETTENKVADKLNEVFGNVHEKTE